MLTSGLNYVGDPHETQYGFVFFWMALSALGANICYSFVYALEFFWAGDNPQSDRLNARRTIAFIAGVLFAMLLALIGGRNIADMEFYHQFRR